MNIAIIPARGGSKRIPKKNIKDFCGYPMIYWVIKKAKESELFDEIIVSTDDKEIAKIAIKFGAKVPFIRSAELSDDYATTASVMADVVKKLPMDKVKYVCCIYPCSPLLDIKDLRSTFEKIKTNKYDFVYPVVGYAHPIFRAMKKTQENKMEFLFPENELKRTQDVTQTFHDAGQFYWGRKDAWIEGKRMHTDGIGFEIPYWKSVDIDTQDDWDRAEILFKCID
jgi:pseudaminic acid cytidylyltransferase